MKEGNKRNITRRNFVASATAGTSAAAVTPDQGDRGFAVRSAGRLAVRGGVPIRTKTYPRWPRWDDTDKEALVHALETTNWGRFSGNLVADVESRFASLMGSKHCLLTDCGTHALHTACHVLGIGAGDEVLVTPYTFVATIDAILLENALPVFVDIDLKTFQIDPDKLEERITGQTRAIMAVDILGGVTQIYKINAVARKRNLKVIHDACQAFASEWKGQRAGSWGDLSCVSFQSTKALTCGEGGALLGNDKGAMDRCYSFHNFGRPRGDMPRDRGSFPIRATKYRVTSFQAALLNSQMNRIEEQVQRRSENADYLTSLIRDVPGIVPQRFYEETTRATYYFYGFRYQKEHFRNVPRGKFLAALRAEGIPCSVGLGTLGPTATPMNREGVIEDALNSKSFQKIYSKKRLDEYRERNHCPESDRLSQEVAGFSQRLLLGDRDDIRDIARAIWKIHENSDELARAVS